LAPPGSSFRRFPPCCLCRPPYTLAYFSCPFRIFYSKNTGSQAHISASASEFQSFPQLHRARLTVLHKISPLFFFFFRGVFFFSFVVFSLSAFAVFPPQVKLSGNDLRRGVAQFLPPLPLCFPVCFHPCFIYVDTHLLSFPVPNLFLPNLILFAPGPHTLSKSGYFSSVVRQLFPLSFFPSIQVEPAFWSGLFIPKATMCLLMLATALLPPGMSLPRGSAHGYPPPSNFFLLHQLFFE